MKFYKRAFCYVTRKKSKTIILMLIMSVAAIMLLGGVSTLQKVQDQRQLIGEKSQTKISVSLNSAEKLITAKDVQQISEIENVAWVNRISSTLASPANFELAAGAEKPQEHKARLYGYDNTAVDGSFSAQLLRLQSGSHLALNSSYAVLLHSRLAEANALSVGDNINFKDKSGNLIEATVQGIYQSLSSSDGGEQRMPTSARAENLIYASHDLIGKLQDTQEYDEVVAYLKNPEELQATQHILEGMLDGYKISAHDALFKRMQSTLQQIEKSTVLVLILTAVTAVAAVTLLLCMWTRERMREFAVLLSLGSSVWEIYLQVLTETLLLFTTALALALPFAYFSLPFLGRLLGGGAENSLEISLYSGGIIPVLLAGVLVLAVATLFALLPLATSNVKALLSHTD